MGSDPVEAAYQAEINSDVFPSRKATRRAIAAWCEAEAKNMEHGEYRGIDDWLLRRAAALRESADGK